MITGVNESQVRAVLDDLVTSPLDDAGAGDAFARAAWSGIAEPGDGVAGLLVTMLGAEPALALLIAAESSERIIDRLRAVGAGEDDVDAEAIGQAIARWMPRLAATEAVASLRRAVTIGAHLLVPTHPLWIEGCTELGIHAPMALWYRGSDTALAGLDDAIALVGARAATGYGEHVTMEAAAGLVDRGHAIISGAAYGIDGMAHRSTLASAGTTLAFLAGGVDRYYPAGHDALLGRIAVAGAVLAEMPCGASPSRWRFLQRNRLIAAASAATVVLEAGSRSGSLNTAGHAAALGRPLGAVPGPVTSPASAGCHILLRDFGATCVTSAAEMSELVRGDVRDQPELEGFRSSEHTRVLDAMSSRGLPVAELARRSGLSVSTVQSALGALDLEGMVTESTSGWRRAVRR